MSKLHQMKFKPLENNTSPMSDGEIEELHRQIPDWQIIDVEGIPRLKREFKLKNYAEALSLTNAISELAERYGHHPLIELTWGRAAVQWWTHDIPGLGVNDFIMAAKTDEIYKKLFS